ncbi:MAG: transposase [Candidatus Altiarchaeales archaeon]|nr:transposase [Candidatus Altiarchaeales archaeon]
MIRSSKHSLGKTNPGKIKGLHRFVQLYRNLLQDIIDHLWEKGFRGKTDTNFEWWFHFDLKKDKLRLPSLLPSWFLEENFAEAYPDFTSRILQCAGKQACSMIHAVIEEQKRRLYVLRNIQRKRDRALFQKKKGTHERAPIDSEALLRNLQNVEGKFHRSQLKLKKPYAGRANPELDSRFVDFEEGEFFEYFVQLKLFGVKNEKGQFIGGRAAAKKGPEEGAWIRIPVEGTRVSDKWSLKLKRLDSVRLCETSLILMFKGKAPKKSGTEILGGDQGVNTVLTLSDGQETQKCIHGHSWRSILEKKNRCMPGSKGFKRACAHETNHVNWSLNRLDWSSVQELFLEHVKDLRKGRRQRVGFLRHWRYPLVTEKCERLSEEEGFHLGRTPNAFRSQRCSSCGWVRKRNRKKSVFTCTSCGNTLGADLNAAINNSFSDLFEVPSWLRSGKYNRKGFFWTPFGFFYPTGEPIVPQTQVKT